MARTKFTRGTGWGMLVTLITAALVSIEVSRAAALADSGPTREQVLEAARVTAASARHAALITLDAAGNIKARTVDPFPVEQDFTVWVGTNRTTRKVGEIKRNNNVTLYYFDDRSQSYLTLIGTAELVEPKSIQRDYWKPEWNAFYSNGRNSDEFLLIKLTPHTLEYMHGAKQIWTHPWKPYVLKFDSAKAKK